MYEGEPAFELRLGKPPRATELPVCHSLYLAVVVFLLNDVYVGYLALHPIDHVVRNLLLGVWWFMIADLWTPETSCL